MGKAKPGKFEPETPQARESEVVPGPELLIDAHAQIHDLLHPFSISYLRPELFESYAKGQDRFRVVQSGLYYQISLTTYLVPEFISWLIEAYDERRNLLLFAQGKNIFHISPELINEALHFPHS